MQTYAVVSHPLWLATASVLILVVYEWRRHGGDGAELGERLGAMLVAVVLGRVPEVGYLLLSPVGLGKAVTNPPWQVDVASAVGGGLTAAAMWVFWRYFDWGRIIPGGAIVLVGTLVPYSAIALFWDISGHVTFDTVLAVYLTAVDRRFAPVFVVALVAIVNRPYVGAHTWLQSIAGFVLGLTVAGGIVTFLLDDETDPTAAVRPPREDA